MLTPFTVGYLQRALLAIVILGIVSGCAGTHVLLRRVAFAADVISHTVFPGVVVAFVWHRSVLAGAACSGLLTAALLAPLGRARRIGEDAAMAILATSFFAFGVVVVSRQRSYTADLSLLLLGRALTVEPGHLVALAVVAVGVVCALVLFHKELVLRAFDPAAAEAMGYRVAWIDVGLHVLIVVSVVAALRTVGTALAVALLITPAAAARLCTSTVVGTMALASALSAAAGVAGLWLSFQASVRYDVRLAAAPTVVGLLTLAFVAVAVTSWARQRRNAGVVELP